MTEPYLVAIIAAIIGGGVIIAVIRAVSNPSSFEELVEKAESRLLHDHLQEALVEDVKKRGGKF